MLVRVNERLLLFVLSTRLIRARDEFEVDDDGEDGRSRHNPGELFLWSKWTTSTQDPEIMNCTQNSSVELLYVAKLPSRIVKTIFVCFVCNIFVPLFILKYTYEVSCIFPYLGIS